LADNGFNVSDTTKAADAAKDANCFGNDDDDDDVRLFPSIISSNGHNPRRLLEVLLLVVDVQSNGFLPTLVLLQ
jgi:hypothetical protein